MDVRLIWTGCDEAGDYIVPNVLSQRDLVSRPDNLDETVLHTDIIFCVSSICLCPNKGSSNFNELAIAITYPKMSFFMGLALIKGVIFPLMHELSKSYRQMCLFLNASNVPTVTSQN